MVVIVIVNYVLDAGFMETHKLFITQLPGKQNVTWNLLCECNYVKFV